MCFKLFSICFPFTDVGVKEELSDVDDTASGTDWLMLNSQQYLMHCLQHRKKHHKALILFNALKKFTHLVYLGVSMSLKFVFLPLGLFNSDNKQILSSILYTLAMWLPQNVCVLCVCVCMLVIIVGWGIR